MTGYEHQWFSSGFDEKFMSGWIRYLNDQIDAWGDSNEYLNTAVFSGRIWEETFLNEVFTDVNLLATALLLIYTYSFFVLGSCSPIHMRCVSAIIGISCIGLSTAAGYGTAFASGY